MATPPNLRAQPATALGPNDQLPIDLNNPTLPNSIEDVLESAKGMEENCKKEMWRYKNSKGEDVILRDVFAKIAAWVDKV